MIGQDLVNMVLAKYDMTQMAGQKQVKVVFLEIGANVLIS